MTDPKNPVNYQKLSYKTENGLFYIHTMEILVRILKCTPQLF